MTFQELQDMVEKEICIDRSNPSNTAIKVPQLHSKYLNLLQKHQLVCIKLKTDHDKMYSRKYLYYKNDYNVMLKSKSEIDAMISGDEEITVIRDKLEYEKAVASYLESVLKQISGLSFLIRDIIEWEKFKVGV